MTTRNRYVPPPASAFRNLSTWLNKAMAHTQEHPHAYPESMPSLEFLTSGFCEDDTARWEIGVQNARVGDDGQSIDFRLEKPEPHLDEDEKNWTQRTLDPAAALVVLLHVLYGDRVAIETSASHKKTPEHLSGLPYHYLAIHVSGDSHFLRVNRLITNTLAGFLSRGNAEDFHDLRRGALGQTLSHSQATKKFGPQKRSYRGREEAVQASLKAWDLNHNASGLSLTRDEYEQMLRDAYTLLDRHPLGTALLDAAE